MIISMLAISIFYISILAVVYFRHSHVESAEIKSYSKLMIVNLFTLICEMSLKIMCATITNGHILTKIVTRMFMAGVIVFTVIMIKYIYYISKNTETKSSEGKNIFIKGLILSCILCITIATFLPYDVVDAYSDYCTGMAANFMYSYCSIMIIIAIILMAKHFSTIKKKKCFPLVIFILGLVVGAIIQRYYPQFTISTVVESLVLFVMYFTIENPDVKTIEMLDAAKDTAEKANKAKSDFLSSMSHEIRTPLNAICGFSECILTSDTLEEAKENASDIVSASQTLLEIVNGILDISKIESGKLELVNVDYDVYKMFHDLTRLIQARIGDKALDFQVNIAEDLPKTLYGDVANLRKIMVNFLTNAVKYTESGYVKFDVSGLKVNDEIYRIFISVKDSGRGIKKEDMDKLFTKFQRLDEDRNTTIEGTGLGLAITKQLIEMMNGKLVVNSVYGEGSEFKVAIDQRISLKAIELEEVTEYVEFDLSGKSILVVDDNKLNLKVASKLLAPYNASISTAESGEECINLYRNGSNYDLILLDDMMPKMRGSECLAQLRQIVGFNIPTVALTANAIQGMKEQYLSLGFNDYLAKPIDKVELNRVLKKFILDKAASTTTVADYDQVNMPAEDALINEQTAMLNLAPETTDTEVTVEQPKPETTTIEISSNGLDPMVEQQILTTLGLTEPVINASVSATEIIPTPTSEGLDQNIASEILNTLGVSNSESAQVVENNETVTEQATIHLDPESVKNVEPKSYAGKRVLIVDDNKLNIKVAKKIMSDYKFEFEDCYSGEDCLDKCSKTKYDLIFMDYMMSHLDGIETFKKLKENPDFNTPVISLTADAVVGAREKFMDAGFSEYISKPIDKGLLNEAIEKVLK